MYLFAPYEKIGLIWSNVEHGQSGYIEFSQLAVCFTETGVRCFLGGNKIFLTLLKRCTCIKSAYFFNFTVISIFQAKLSLSMRHGRMFLDFAEWQVVLGRLCFHIVIF